MELTLAAFSQSTATVAAWNLAGFNRISDKKLKNQIQGLALLDAELVTLVEIPDEAHLTALQTGLAAMGLDYESLFVAQAALDHPLHIGLLFKKGVVVKNHRLLDDSDDGDIGNRKALVAEVEIGAFDFTLIGVHLKSGRGNADQAIRDRQCKVIGDFITDLRGPTDRNPDVLLMGDFNMIPGQDTSNFYHLGGNDIMDFVSSWDLQERYSHILEAGRANLLDGFAVSKRFMTEYIKGSLRLFPMHWTMDIGRERFRTDVSDHLPFVASFRIVDRD